VAGLFIPHPDVVQVLGHLGLIAFLGGAEELISRARKMFTTFPHTKTYFAHKDISENSPFLRTKHFNTLTTTMAQLSAFHAYILMIDPYNFKLLSHCILVTLSSWKGDEFSPEAHAAWDKYLSALSAVLAEKYR
uniref:Hemoglobin alpha embryonic-4 n=1 Tax=Erpetoichthys calabaricus TaxID=27687 RepID=A0A8C4T432_ERPCA